MAFKQRLFKCLFRTVVAYKSISYTMLWKSLFHQNENPVANTREKKNLTRMWANAQRDGRPAEHRWRPLLNAAKFG